MTTRYPIWMIIILILQFLLLLALAGFYLMIAGAFDGIIPPGAWLITLPLATTLLVAPLSVWQWRAGRQQRAWFLAIAPVVILMIVIEVLALFPTIARYK